MHLPSSTDPRALRRLRQAACAFVLLACALLVLPAASADTSGHRVAIENYDFGPALAIDQGDTVTWTNLDSAPHDVAVTSGPVTFRSPTLDQGESWSHTFTTAGSYSYVCSIHPDMKGSVTVAPAPVPEQHHHTSAPESIAPSPQSTPTAAPAASPREGASSAASTTGDRRTAKRQPTPAAATPAEAVSQEATLDPLLLVMGFSVAVVVFCLLLMASRPSTPTPPEPEPGRAEPTAPGLVTRSARGAPHAARGPSAEG